MVEGYKNWIWCWFLDISTFNLFLFLVCKYNVINIISQENDNKDDWCGHFQLHAGGRWATKAGFICHAFHMYGNPKETEVYRVLQAMVEFYIL